MPYNCDTFNLLAMIIIKGIVFATLYSNTDIIKKNNNYPYNWD